MQSELNEKGDNDAVLDALNRVRVLETEMATLKSTSSVSIASAAASITSICTKVRTLYAYILTPIYINLI